MHEQLGHLMEVSRSNKVVLQVLTYAAGAHPAMDGAFEILRFPETADADIVYVQYRRVRSPSRPRARPRRVTLPDHTPNRRNLLTSPM